MKSKKYITNYNKWFESIVETMIDNRDSIIKHVFDYDQTQIKNYKCQNAPKRHLPRLYQVLVNSDSKVVHNAGICYFFYPVKCSNFECNSFNFLRDIAL